MPDRSKKELEQIYDDLLELKQTLNWLNSFGDLWPTPMNGKTWEQEKNEFWNREIKAFEGLIREGKVQSCEIRSLCEKEARANQLRKRKEGFWNHVSSHPSHSSEYIIYDGFSLDQFLDIYDKALNDPKAIQEKKIVNHVLDVIGTPACEARACIQNLDQEGNDLSNQPNDFKPSRANFRT
jgi:hypothetical protein